MHVFNHYQAFLVKLFCNPSLFKIFFQLRNNYLKSLNEGYNYKNNLIRFIAIYNSYHKDTTFKSRMNAFDRVKGSATMCISERLFLRAGTRRDSTSLYAKILLNCDGMDRSYVLIGVSSFRAWSCIRNSITFPWW